MRDLIRRLADAGLHLSVNEGKLRLRSFQSTPQPACLEEIRTHREALISYLQEGMAARVAESAPNPIPPGCIAITPQMLPLVKLTEQDIELIVTAVPGGASNVQDIYPLVPLQEGMLFHHLMSKKGDPYLFCTLLKFDTRERVHGILTALQAVIDRHDILRTAVMWAGLTEPVQVVWRRAPMSVQEVVVDPEGDVEQQLAEHCDPRHRRLDVRCAPLLSGTLAHDQRNDRWLLALLNHHLVMDHSTIEALLQEVRAHLLNEQDRLSRPVPFRNLVARARLGGTREEHAAFFRGMLGDIDAPTAPFGLLNVQGDGSDVNESSLRLGESLAKRVRSCARTAGVSAASLCHLAWGRVLALLSNREEVVFGTVLFGRMHSGADWELGMFINTLPIRLSIADQSVRESLLSTHHLLAELSRHEFASLALAQRFSAVAAPAPLFSTMLNYRYNPDNENVSTSWEGIEILRDGERTNYPLTLTVDDLGEAFRLTAQVIATLDPRRICLFMHTALESLVDALEREPQKAVRTTEVLPVGELSQLLVQWNDTEAPYPRDRLVHELFEDQVEHAPDTVALEHDGLSLTYAELDAKSNQLAHYLKAVFDVRPESRVALLMDRGIDAIVAMLAVLKEGAAYVPMDPGYPPGRLAAVLEDTDPVVILTHSSLRGKLPPGEAAVVLLDSDEVAIAGYSPRAQPPHGPTPRSLAYVMFTSGSAGTPRSVMVEHLSVVKMIHAHIQVCGLHSADRILQFSSLCFDTSVVEIFATLAVGGTLVMGPSEMQAPDLRFGGFLQTQRISIVAVTAAFWRRWTRQLGAENTCAGELPRVVFCRGDKVFYEDLRSWFHHPGARRSHWIKGYGPTEATVYAVAIGYRAGDVLPTGIVPLGRPIANTRIYLLDRHGAPVPVGVVGEIYIGGVGVARGYLDRLEPTAERFLKDPFCGDPRARMYRTGDLGRYLPDGVIELLDRA